ESIRAGEQPRPGACRPVDALELGRAVAARPKLPDDDIHSDLRIVWEGLGEGWPKTLFTRVPISPVATGARTRTLAGWGARRPGRASARPPARPRSRQRAGSPPSRRTRRR